MTKNSNNAKNFSIRSFFKPTGQLRSIFKNFKTCILLKNFFNQPMDSIHSPNSSFPNLPNIPGDIGGVTTASVEKSKTTVTTENAQPLATEIPVSKMTSTMAGVIHAHQEQEMKSRQLDTSKGTFADQERNIEQNDKSLGQVGGDNILPSENSASFNQVRAKQNLD